jgi:hypothetical protein
LLAADQQTHSPSFRRSKRYNPTLLPLFLRLRNLPTFNLVIIFQPHKTSGDFSHCRMTMQFREVHFCKSSEFTTLIKPKNSALKALNFCFKPKSLEFEAKNRDFKPRSFETEPKRVDFEAQRFDFEPKSLEIEVKSFEIEAKSF